MECIYSYFENLGKLNFISAKNKIKLIVVEDNNSSLSDLLNQIVCLERNYCNLIFITYKQSGLLGRKKQTESFIDSRVLLNEIKNSKKFLSSNCDVIFSNLMFLLDHRCNMIEFYKSISGLKSKPGFMVSDSLPKLKTIKNSLEKLQDEKRICDPLLLSITIEVRVLSKLLEAHDKTTNLYFLDPLNEMQAANTDLNQFELIHRQSELAMHPLPLLNWLRDLSRFVLDKYTLYFQPILSKYSILTIGYSMSPDSFPMVDKIRQFAFKQAPCVATLLFDTTKQIDTYTSHGYVLPHTHVEPLIGLQNYQSIFSTSVTPMNQDELFVTVSLIREKIDNQQKKVAHLIQNSHNHRSTSYFVCKIELRVYLSLIFASNKNEKDRHILSFINDISNELQGLRMIEFLRVE